MSKSPFKPQNGTYEGYFSLAGKRHALEVDMRWSGPSTFWGDGVDEEGDFKLTGTVDAAPPYKVTLERRGKEGTREGEGFREGSSAGMYGHWTCIDGTKGEFLLKPATGPSKIRQMKRAKVVDTLQGMGYEEWLITDALEATNTSSLGEALDWMNNQLEKMNGASQSPAAPPDRGAAASVDNDNNGSGGDTGEAVAQLVSMGFNAEQAAEALGVCAGNVERALEYLISCANE